MLLRLRRLLPGATKKCFKKSQPLAAPRAKKSWAAGASPQDFLFGGFLFVSRAVQDRCCQDDGPCMGMGTLFVSHWPRGAAAAASMRIRTLGLKLLP